jgi:ketosteroid isomerase-like protein
VSLDELRLRSQLDKFNRAFSEGAIDSYLEELDPEVDLGTVTAMAEGQPLHGHQEVRAYLERLHEAFLEMSVEAESFEPVAEGIVLTLGRWRARGRSSGVSVDSPWAVASHLAPDGRALWVRAFTDEAEARAAARDRAHSIGLDN